MREGTVLRLLVQEAINEAEVTRSDLQSVNDCLGADLWVEFRLTRAAAVMDRLKKFYLRRLIGCPRLFMNLILGGHLTLPMQRINLTRERISGEMSEDTLLLSGPTSEEMVLDLAAHIVLTEIMMRPASYRLSPHCSLRKIS